MWSGRSFVQARVHTDAKARVAQACQEARARTDAKAQRRQARGGEKRTSQEKDIAITSLLTLDTDTKVSRSVARFSHKPNPVKLERGVLSIYRAQQRTT